MSAYQIVVTIFRESSTPYTLEFEHFPVTIGSLVSNDVVLDHPAVSRKHALVALSHGRVLFVDQSSNGSYLRQKRVSRQVLEDADVISILPFRLRFSLSVAEPPEGTNILPRQDELQTGLLSGAEVVAARQPLKPMLRLVIGDEDAEPKELELTRQPVIIGRAEDADFLVQDEMVSRHHARITWRADGSFWLEDLNSSNGTYINKRRISAESVQPGDRIQLGIEVPLELFLDGAEQPVVTGQVTEPLPVFRGPEDTSSSVVSMPPLALSSRRASGAREVFVLGAAGRLDGYTYTKLTEAFDRAVDRGERHLVLDLSAIDFVDHAGLGALVKAMTTLESLGGQLRLIGLSQRLRETFTLSRLDSVFREQICETEEEAVADLGPYPAGNGQRSVEGD